MKTISFTKEYIMFKDNITLTISLKTLDNIRGLLVF